MDSSTESSSSCLLNKMYATHLRRLKGEEGLFCNRYKIKRVLGKGGFGITFLAQDILDPDRSYCVIKQLYPEVRTGSALATARQRFEQEAITLGKVGNHPQIPQLLNYFEVNGEFYLVQEFIKGPTLALEVWRQGSFSEGIVKKFLRQVLPVLQYVHEHQVIHRDIKPLNLIRSTETRQWVLIDFGGVKELPFSMSTPLKTLPSTHFLGTAGFAAPEQLSKRPVYASDIYSIGVCCLYLLTGKPPHEFNYDSATGEIEWRDRVFVSDYFGAVLNKMLKVRLKERYASAREVLIDLENDPEDLSLALCMSVQPPLLTDEASEGYLPPAVRTARAIREWKARQEAKKRHQPESVV